MGTDPIASTACDERTTRPSSQRTTTRVGLVVALDRRRPRPLEQAHATGEEVVLEHGGDLGVLARQHLLARHDERDLGAERGEHVHELDAGDTRADDRDAARELLRRVAVTRRQDAVAVGLAPLRDARARAGGDEGDVEVDQLGAVDVVDLDLVRARRSAPCRGSSARPGSAAARSCPCCRWCLDPLDARRQRLGVDLADACSRPIPVERRRKLIAPPVAIIVFDGMQSSRWAAPPIDVALDHRHLGAEPGGVRGRGVAGRPTTDDEEAGGHRRVRLWHSADCGRRRRNPDRRPHRIDDWTDGRPIGDRYRRDRARRRPRRRDR